MEELISQRKELEDELLLLRQKKRSLGDIESTISIMKIENELENLNNRIKVIEHQQKTQNIDTIRTILGVTFTDSYYGMSGQDINSPPSIMYKTLKQIQKEYTQLDMNLQEKLDDRVITAEQHKIALHALRTLYYEYKNNIVNREKQSQQPQVSFTSSGEYNPNKISTEQIDLFESIRAEARRNSNYDNMSSEQKKDFDRELEETIRLTKKRNLFMDKYGYEEMNDDEKYVIDKELDEREKAEIAFRKRLISRGIDPERLPNYNELVDEDYEKSKLEISKEVEEVEGHKRRY